MADRYYPGDSIIERVQEPISTYELLTRQETQERSTYPPGYSGHQHGKKFKFGYSVPSADPVGDADKPGVDYDEEYYAAQRATGTAAKGASFTLTKAAPKQTLEQTLLLNGSLTLENPLQQSFARTCISKNTPAPAGAGTGHYLKNVTETLKWGDNAPVEYTSSTEASYTTPVMERSGLGALSYTQTLA